MPNWCVGTLKVRGTKEEIITFMKRALQPIDFLGNDQPVEIEEDEYEFSIKTDKNVFYLNGTRRNFIDSSYIDFYHDDEDGLHILTLNKFKAAWGIDAGALASISKEYNVDFRIYAFEQGMEFNQEIEIHKGEIIKNIEIKFDDYQWECIDPTLGG